MEFRVPWGRGTTLLAVLGVLLAVGPARGGSPGWKDVASANKARNKTVLIGRIIYHDPPPPPPPYDGETKDEGYLYTTKMAKAGGHSKHLDRDRRGCFCIAIDPGVYRIVDCDIWAQGTWRTNLYSPATFRGFEYTLRLETCPTFEVLPGDKVVNIGTIELRFRRGDTSIAGTKRTIEVIEHGPVGRVEIECVGNFEDVLRDVETRTGVFADSVRACAPDLRPRP